MDEHETPVIFRADGRGRDREITAVFPCEPHDLEGYSMTCYAHVGQHGGCVFEWYNGTHAARPEEYADLVRELSSEPYGYRLKVYRRMQPWMRDALHAEARRLRNRPAS